MSDEKLFQRFPFLRCVLEKEAGECRSDDEESKRGEADLYGEQSEKLEKDSREARTDHVEDILTSACVVRPSSCNTDSSMDTGTVCVQQPGAFAVDGIGAPNHDIETPSVIENAAASTDVMDASVTFGNGRFAGEIVLEATEVKRIRRAPPRAIQCCTTFCCDGGRCWMISFYALLLTVSWSLVLGLSLRHGTRKGDRDSFELLAFLTWYDFIIGMLFLGVCLCRSCCCYRRRNLEEV